MYIYVSNESPVNVFFDNLQVVHTRSAILEETHYYPFGLIMQGISSKALNGIADNKYKFNDGTELNSKEFSDGSGLELYETPFRGYDPQIGRFWQIDAMAGDYEECSPYIYSFNNPISFNDPTGLDPERGLTPETAKQLETVVLKSTPKNNWNYIDWAYFADVNKRHDVVDLHKYLKNQGVNDRGLTLFNKAFGAIPYRERKEKIDEEWWNIQRAIAEGAISIFGGRLFIKIGLKLIPLSRLNTLLTEAGIKIYGNASVLYNKALGKFLETISKNWPVKDIKSFEQLGKILNEGSKFRDILKDKKTLENLKELFDNIKKFTNLEL